jgi:hypothetical protein
MKSQGYWTAEREDALRGMIERGLSAGQCARALAEQFGPGVTRNAVIGIVRRRGWQSRNMLSYAAAQKPRPACALTPRPAAPRTAPAPRPAPAAAKPKPAPTTGSAPSFPAGTAALKGWPKPASEHAVTIIGLTSKTCRMPLWADDCSESAWDRLYCGRLVKHEGSSWCAGCFDILKGSGSPSERRAHDLAEAERLMRRPARALA